MVGDDASVIAQTVGFDGWPVKMSPDVFDRGAVAVSDQVKPAAEAEVGRRENGGEGDAEKAKFVFDGTRGAERDRGGGHGKSSGWGWTLGGRVTRLIVTRDRSCGRIKHPRPSGEVMHGDFRQAGPGAGRAGGALRRPVAGAPGGTGAAQGGKHDVEDAGGRAPDRAGSGRGEGAAGGSAGSAQREEFQGAGRAV